MRWALATLLALSATASRPARADTADPWFGQDKFLHFGVSGLISSDAYLATRLAHGPRGMALGIGAGVALAAGVGKELYDLTGRGDPSWRDLTWDVVGTATGLLVAWSFDRLLAREPEHHALQFGDWRLRIGVGVGAR